MAKKMSKVGARAKSNVKAPRATTTYEFHGADGTKHHCGITDDPARRQGEHRRRFGEPEGSLDPVGNKKTRAGARAWEKEQGCSPYDLPRRNAVAMVSSPRAQTRYRPTRVGGSGVVKVVATLAAVVTGGVFLAALFGGGSSPVKSTTEG